MRSRTVPAGEEEETENIYRVTGLWSCGSTAKTCCLFFVQDTAHAGGSLQGSPRSQIPEFILARLWVPPEGHCTILVQCHRRVVVLGSNRGRTNQNQSRSDPGMRLTTDSMGPHWWRNEWPSSIEECPDRGRANQNQSRHSLHKKLT